MPFWTKLVPSWQIVTRLAFRLAPCKHRHIEATKPHIKNTRSWSIKTCVRKQKCKTKLIFVCLVFFLFFSNEVRLLQMQWVKKTLLSALEIYEICFRMAHFFFSEGHTMSIWKHFVFQNGPQHTYVNLKMYSTTNLQIYPGPKTSGFFPQNFGGGGGTCFRGQFSVPIGDGVRWGGLGNIVRWG